MLSLFRARAVLICGVLCGVAASCAAQAYEPPPPPLTTLPPCPADKDAKKRAKRKDCDPTVYPAETRSGKPTETQAGPPAGAAAADKFPFPGEPAPAAAPAATKFPFPGENPGGGSGSESAPRPDDTASATSSGSSSSSSDDARPADAGDGPKGARAKNPDDDDDDEPPKLIDKGSEGRRGKKIAKPQTDEERVDEDLSVAKFYAQSGNYMGAYLRAKDAVATQPDYAEAHFALGEAAQRLKKKDEAVAEFQAYLKLAPDGEKAKQAEKVLAELK